MKHSTQAESVDPAGGRDTAVPGSGPSSGDSTSGSPASAANVSSPRPVAAPSAHAARREVPLLAYLGPPGTFSHEALTAALVGRAAELIGLPTIYDTIMAVHDRRVHAALVPMENSLEGSVNATLDTLANEADDVRIVGELIHPVRHCLIAAAPLELGAIEEVVSHPQVTAQCARFIRHYLPQARVVAATSSAEAVRRVAEGNRSSAALGTRQAAQRYGCVILRRAVEDAQDNVTRFVWLGARDARLECVLPPGGAPRTTSVVFWGLGADAPGALVRCLSEFAFRGVNLSRIESRPRREGLGRYMFFVDLEGGVEEPAVAGALEALSRQAQTVRVLGSYPAAPAPSR